MTPPKTFIIKSIKRFIFWQSSFGTIVSYADLSPFSNAAYASELKSLEVGLNCRQIWGVINFPDEFLTEHDRKVPFTNISDSAGMAVSCMK